ncbi:hypothetical protein GCM10011531_04760 [Aquaticitalea lipolytica]|uniref:Adhesin domain-containing protein n=1 Tax=Aquaticitalea lipolytica TaxID=1247562 RepID=A0A8J2XFA9_9FLAO|nr:hypothetical protein [Aquaticitalea lipolytica]GFZ78266.1 hypothetical protein GCM10011531_04760 [Aquaticitalea lipolytica]
MKTNKIIVLLMLVTTFSISAQQKQQKLSKSVKANSDVTINLNTSHTNIEVDTWSKDEIEIEAYIEGEKLSKEELQEELKNWNITVSGSGAEVTIESKGSFNTWTGFSGFDDESFAALRALEFELAEMPEFPELPEMPNFEHFSEMPKMPELPELPSGISSINFDYDAYKKDGEKYLDKWSKEYETKYGKEFRDKMKAWGIKFGETNFEAYSKDMEKWGEKFGEKFGKEYEEKMAAWGEKFGKQMEARTKAMEERSKAMESRQEAMKDRQEALENRKVQIARTIENKVNTKVKKTIKIKMPKKAKLKMNVRHGELKFASVITNLRGNISHSALTANSIDGSQTSINVSYSPVLITNWNLGELKLNYVDKALIENVNRMVLNSNSSNININNLKGNAVIDGSFGELNINKILDTFNNLNIILENSEALIVLPAIAHNLQYKGSRSKLKHPKSKTNTTTTFSTGDLMSGKTIVINAKFSEVTMQ